MIDIAFLLVAAAAFLCGWLARWQWDRKHWEPEDEWGDVFDRWDRS